MKRLPVVQKLQDELKKVERELRIDIPRELGRAAAHGDLRENAEHQAAKERQRFLEARASQLDARIKSLASLKLEDIPKDVVGLGSRVHLEEISTGNTVVYELVTPEEVDPKNGKISVSSPVGRALLRKTEGDDVSMELPSGIREYGILRVETLHDLLLSEEEG